MSSNCLGARVGEVYDSATDVNSQAECSRFSINASAKLFEKVLSLSCCRSPETLNCATPLEARRELSSCSLAIRHLIILLYFGRVTLIECERTLALNAGNWSFVVGANSRHGQFEQRGTFDGIEHQRVGDVTEHGFPSHRGALQIFHRTRRVSKPLNVKYPFGHRAAAPEKRNVSAIRVLNVDDRPNTGRSFAAGLHA